VRLALLPLLTVLASAQEGPGFDPASASAERWRAELGFTEEQARRFETAGETRARAVEPVKERLRSAVSRLRSLLDGGADEAAVGEALLELARLRAALQRENARYDDELAGFLSPSQRARLLILMHGLRPNPPASRASFSSKS